MVGAPDRDGSEPDALGRLRELLPGGPEAQITEDHVQSVLTLRRARQSIFGRQLFSDPAWDLILELYATRLGNRRISAAGLARLIGLPGSMTARWVSALVEAGIVRVETEGAVELTDEGVDKMARLINQWSSAFLAI